MPEWRYRGRAVSAEEIAFIRRLITEHPTASRRRLSEKLCEAWQWKQANGAPRDMVCRGPLLMLHRAGEIELPAISLPTAESAGAARAAYSGDVNGRFRRDVNNVGTWRRWRLQ